MRTFEIGKRYNEGAAVFEIVARTNKTVTFVRVQHSGRFNERKSETKKAKILNWDSREVFMVSDYTVEA